MHGTPPGFPCGIPGIGEEMEGAIQHAPQCSLHCIKKGVNNSLPSYKVLIQILPLSFSGIEIRRVVSQFLSAEFNLLIIFIKEGFIMLT